jgi:hypothetical protein
MTALERRHVPQRLRVTPSGALLDEAAYDAMLAGWARTAEARTVRVRRLSMQDGPDRLPELSR